MVDCIVSQSASSKKLGGRTSDCFDIVYNGLKI